MVQGKILLDTRSKGKKGHPIKIYISGNGSKKYISTGYFSMQEHWRDGVTRKHPNYSHLSTWIKRREFELQQQLNYCNEHGYTLREAVQYIKGKSSPQDEIEMLEKRLRELRGQPTVSLFDFWQQITHERKLASKSTRAFDQTLSQIRKFTDDIPISDITPGWIEGFKAFKYSEGCGDPGVHFYLVTIRTVYYAAARRKLIEDQKPFNGLIPQSVSRKKKVRLSKSDLLRIANYSPSKYAGAARGKAIEQRIAIFLFQIYIGGHDLVDVAGLTWDDVSGGRVSFMRKKIKRGVPVQVDNILLPQAQDIINRHGTPKAKRVFSFIPPHGTEQYEYYRRYYWKALKQMSEKLEITPPLKTKSPRYIFRTWAGDSGANIIHTMQIQGHKPKEETFKYQGRVPNRIVDQVLQQVLQEDV
ncbi:putative integrase [Robiginitalea biformata HTCC2501]|uniref:Putative integrase n=1 Tax=Robiginitalea biformata (strain ATCC BAA-864 / DSM 15991 / KCTC 12146 / HTCC2501) TaxID=313596 RepID=A4CPX3_ROBBH|nr:putative integrase [Robiginitalea biformata HTCC2501]